MKIKITLIRPLFCSFFEGKITRHSHNKHNKLINNTFTLIPHTLMMQQAIELKSGSSVELKGIK